MERILEQKPGFGAEINMWQNVRAAISGYFLSTDRKNIVPRLISAIQYEPAEISRLLNQEKRLDL